MEHNNDIEGDIYTSTSSKRQQASHKKKQKRKPINMKLDLRHAFRRLSLSIPRQDQGRREGSKIDHVSMEHEFQSALSNETGTFQMTYEGQRVERLIKPDDDEVPYSSLPTPLLIQTEVAEGRSYESVLPSPTPVFRNRRTPDMSEWWKCCKCDNDVNPAQHDTICTCSHELCNDCKQAFSRPPTPIRD